MVKKIINPFEDIAFNRRVYEGNRELIARGVNPYCCDENIGASDAVYWKSKRDNLERGAVKGCKKESKIRYNISGYARAEEIVRNFSREEKYLRSLIANVTGNGSYADHLDFRGLLREGFKIKGIVEKILKHKRE